MRTSISSSAGNFRSGTFTGGCFTGSHFTDSNITDSNITDSIAAGTDMDKMTFVTRHEAFFFRSGGIFRRLSGGSLALLLAASLFLMPGAVLAYDVKAVMQQDEYVIIDNESGIQALADEAAPVTPLTRSCKKPMRLAVAQRGSYDEFQTFMRALLDKLHHDGYLKMNASLHDSLYVFDDPDTWKLLSEGSRGGCVELIPDGLYTGSWENGEIWDQASGELKRRIASDHDVDMLLGLGLASGVKFADPSLGIPVMIGDASSPETAGIIGPGEFSDKPGIHVQKYPKRISMAMRSYYSIFSFKKLGMMADVDETIRKMQSYEVIRNVGREEGFEVVPCFGSFQDKTDNKNIREFERCRAELLDKGIDALYMPVFDGLEEEQFFSYIQPFVENDVIIMGDGATAGAKRVEKGVLVSLVEVGLEESGRFEADVMEHIIDGVPPEKISQYYNTNMAFALNLKTARLVNWKPSFEFLMLVEYLFENINFK
ncbi:MAG: hypothetical protein VZR11_06805 [Succinimonas sp.]|nr:hypothetical protein [Succinimonas sp.]